MRLYIATCLLFKAHYSRVKRRVVPSRYRHEYRNALSPEALAVRQRRIPRISLTTMKNSPWRKVFHSGNDQAMITLTGFTCEAFEYLIEKFSPVYYEFTPFVDMNGFIIRKISKAGRPRLMKAHDCLGLYLAWSRTRGSLMVLQLLFGMTYTAVLKYIQFARRIIIKVLKKDPLAKIAIPSHEQIETYRALIERRHPALPDVWGTMDGLKIKIDAAPDEITQSRFYNGWKHCHFVTAVLCFTPDGTIPACYYNVPGCSHDSTVADWGCLYDKLEKVYEETGLKFVIDSAFCTTNIPFLIKSSQDDLTADAGMVTFYEQVDNIARKREATSM